MRSRAGLFTLLLVFALQSGFDCTGQPTLITFNPEIQSGLISSFSFPIQVTVAAGAYQPGTLQFTLNGQPLALAGGPLVFSTTMNPGAPLLDNNQLVVTGTATNGVQVTTQRDFQYAPPKAKLRKITSAGDLMSGPIADGQIGDYLMENAVARFIVQDVGKRDLNSIGQYGGNIIDAELVGHPGQENFFEVQPAINIETVINAQTVDILNDGQNGLPAQLRTCGPDDTMDIVNASSVAAQVGAVFPLTADDIDYNVEGCTVYTLEPGKKRVKLETTISNLDGVPRGLYVGDYINGMGELEQWTDPLGVGELVTSGLSVLDYIGFGEAQGVDYGFTAIPFAGSATPQSSFFTQVGVSYVLASHSIVLVLFFGNTPTGAPTFQVPANGSKSFVRYFGVGDGSGGNAVDLANEVKALANGTISGCVTAGGSPAPGARVSLGAKDAGSTKLVGVTSIWVADANGCFSGTVPTGTYGVVAAKEGHPYEGGGAFPTVHTVTITNGGSVVQNVALPATGHLHEAVVDESSTAIPARVTIAGFDPSTESCGNANLCPTIILAGGFGLPSANTGVFNDVAKDAIPYGVARVDYTPSNGVIDVDVEPGSYQVYVSRGTEYSAYASPVTISAGVTTNVSAQIARVLDTPGFVSSDYHVHAISSPDSRISYTRRIKSFGGEGVENLILTEHDAHFDLTSKIAADGYTPFLHTIIGEEITSFDYGHFNAYPMLFDPTQPSGGSTDFGAATPPTPGQHFVQYASYTRSPGQIYAAATTGSASTPDTVVQINHIDSHFSPLRINTSLVPPQSVLTSAQKLALRLDPTIPNMFHHFPALELWNGNTRGDQTQFLAQRIGIWFNHLNQGLSTTMIGDTDTHTFFDTNGGGSRTWTPSTSDAPAGIANAEVANAIRTGRAVSGQGVYVQTRLLAGDGSGNVADFTKTGSTLVQSSNGTVNLEIKVQAPTYAEYDRIEIYANAATTVAGSNGGVPVLFGATPTLILNKGAGDFTVSTVTPYPAVPTAQRQETTKTVSFAGLAQDTWFVVVVKGLDGVSRPMFPVFPASLKKTTNTTLPQLLDGNLGEDGVMALGNTNALYADVDGTPGFHAPLAP